nr:hypothetical protein [Tanacetum cinerariifolium]
MLCVFPITLTGTASRWLRIEPAGSITSCEIHKEKFLTKYYRPARTSKKIEEINNFLQEPNETLCQAWKRFKELLLRCPQHYLTNMHEVILYSKGLDMPTRQILDSKALYQKRVSSNTYDGLAAIQAQLNIIGREIKKVNEKVYATQVGCGLCNGPHYTKDCPLKEEVKTLEEAYYTQFGVPFPQVGRHDENSNLIKEIRASMDAAIRNQGASTKALEIQIG